MACDVIAMVADVGQGDDLDAVVGQGLQHRREARSWLMDLREEFLRDYVFPTVRAGAVYEHKYLLGTSHGAGPSSPSTRCALRSRKAPRPWRTAAPARATTRCALSTLTRRWLRSCKIIAPWREWDAEVREDCLDYAEAHGMPLAQSRAKIHSRDRNIWHISHEGGELEDANNAPLDSTWAWTRSPQDAPDKEETVEIGFAEGIPVSVNGQNLPPVQLVELLNEIGARNAVGRIDIVENRFVGMKSRGASMRLLAARCCCRRIANSKRLCLDRELAHFKQLIGLKYAELVYYGLWFTPLREALDSFVTKTQERVTGTVKLALYKGNICDRRARQSAYSLYSNRAVVVHHGRELRPEGRRGLHSHSRAARAHPGGAARLGKKGSEVAK